MERDEGDIGELIEFWTLVDGDREVLVGKRGANALGFALLLKHYSRFGRFPRGRSDLPDAVVEFVLVRSVLTPRIWASTSGPVARSSITATRSEHISGSALRRSATRRD